MFPAVAGVQPETSRSIKPRERDLGDLRLFVLVRILTRPTNHPRHAACASNNESKPVRPHFFWRALPYPFDSRDATSSGRSSLHGAAKNRLRSARACPTTSSMPELKDFASSVAIVVSSCDAFFDA